jgi:hypothetical protein
LLVWHKEMLKQEMEDRGLLLGVLPAEQSRARHRNGGKLHGARTYESRRWLAEHGKLGLLESNGQESTDCMARAIYASESTDLSYIFGLSPGRAALNTKEHTGAEVEAQQREESGDVVQPPSGGHSTRSTRLVRRVPACAVSARSPIVKPCRITRALAHAGQSCGSARQIFTGRGSGSGGRKANDRSPDEDF